MKAFIGIDTSCYTTSCAAVSEDGEVLASCRALLPVKQGERGLRQSEAVYAHVRQLPALVQGTAKRLDSFQIAAFCASATPRDAEDSFMPVFQVGSGFAQSAAELARVPCYLTTHQRGHLAAAKVGTGLCEENYLALHLSGGTTELLCVRGASLALLGGTLDLHAGQLVDRCGVALGLPFPSGPHLEALAVSASSQALLPVSMEKDGLHCHLSGAEAQVRRWIERGELPPERIAREVYDLLARTVCRLLLAGEEATGISHALIAGGVASSALFRQLLRERVSKKSGTLKLYFGHPEYSGDNAVGVALLGLEAWKKQADSH